MVGLGLGFRLGLGYNLDTVVMGRGKVGIIFMAQIRFSAETKVGLSRRPNWEKSIQRPSFGEFCIKSGKNPAVIHR